MTIRVIHDHEVNALNRMIKLMRSDGLGNPGVEGRIYDMILGPDFGSHRLQFHQDNTVHVGALGQTTASTAIEPNGLTNEVLLAIVKDRLECSQRGAHRCREDALALTKIEEALHWLGAKSPYPPAG